MEEVSVAIQEYPHFYRQKDESLKHDKHYYCDAHAFRSNPWDPIHNKLVYLELIMTILNTTKANVLVVIKGKKYMQYLPSMKVEARKKNLKKYCLFYKDKRHNTKECYTLKRKIKQLITKGHLQLFMKKGLENKKEEEFDAPHK